jgi:hypothetical protein
MAWEVKKDANKFQFCYISGGYVVVGTRDKTSPLTTSSSESHIDDFDKQVALQNTIKTEMGDKIFAEVYDKVQKLLAVRHQKTSSPQMGN